MISLGLVDHIADPHFGGYGRDAAPLGRHSVEAKAVWERGFAELTTAEIVELFHQRGGDAVPFTDYPQIVDHPQTAAIEALCEVSGADGSTVRAVSPVWKFSATPVHAGPAAPALGADTAAILTELDGPPRSRVAMPGRAAGSPRPGR